MARRKDPVHDILTWAAAAPAESVDLLVSMLHRIAATERARPEASAPVPAKASAKPVRRGRPKRPIPPALPVASIGSDV